MFRHSRRSLQALRRPFIASTSKRSIISWVSDVVQTRSLFPPNPILDSLERSLQQRGDGLTSDNIVTPQLSRARPHHVQQAAVQIQEQYLSDLQEIETKAKSIVSLGPSIRPADASAALQEIVLSLNRIQAKGRSVQQTASLLWLNSDLEKKTQWKKAASEVTSTLEFAHEESQSIHNALRLLLDSVEKSSSENEPDSTDQDVLWAAKFLIRTYKHRVGDGLDSEKKQQFSDISLALEEVEAGLQFSSGRSSQQRVGDFYNYVGLRTEQAKMLGYRNVAEMVMEPRMASLEKVKNLHESISERVLPLLDAERKASKSKDELALDAYLSPQSDTGNSNTIDPRRLDEFERIRLEQHVTLDGTLAFIARLSKDILGVSFVEETENVHGWHRDVRLFHVYDELDSSTYIGSFFLDPFERIGKLERASTTPIYVRGLDSKPVVSVSLNIVAPMWDNLPVPMTWDDIANSLHEIAHVYQFMLARPTLGGIVGPHNMPFDLRYGNLEDEKMSETVTVSPRTHLSFCLSVTCLPANSYLNSLNISLWRNRRYTLSLTFLKASSGFQTKVLMQPIESDRVLRLLNLPSYAFTAVSNCLYSRSLI